MFTYINKIILHIKKTPTSVFCTSGSRPHLARQDGNDPGPAEALQARWDATFGDPWCEKSQVLGASGSLWIYPAFIGDI